jgi:hypothetical protein
MSNRFRFGTGFTLAHDQKTNLLKLWCHFFSIVGLAAAATEI